MMKIQVRNFGACERADIYVDGITIVGGNNGHGKSSILRSTALAACMLRMPHGHPLKDAKTLVKNGAEEGSVGIGFTGDLSSDATRITWPEAKVESIGTPPHLSPIAAGLVTICGQDPDKVADLIGRYVSGDPTKTDLELALSDIGVNEENTKKIWEMIDKDGWDITYKHAVTRGTETKGAWEHTTAAGRWGAKKGAEWQPKGWTDEIANMTVEDCDREIARRKADIEELVSKAAIEDHELKKMEDAVEGLEYAVEQLKEATKASDATRKSLADAKDAREHLPKAENVEPLEYPCPHCGGVLVWKAIDKGIKQLTKSDGPLDKKELEVLRKKIADADAKLSRAQLDFDAAAAEFSKWNEAVTLGQAAQQALLAAEGNNISQEEIALAREALAQAENVKEMCQDMKTAAKQHAMIVMNAKVQKILAPEGLRRTILARALKKFHADFVDPVVAKVGLPQIRLEPDMTTSMDGFTYKVLSQGHRWITRAVMQLAIAQAEGARYVIMDGADVLDRAGRNALINAVKALNMNALVGMTFNAADDVPPLKKAGLGRAYWVQDGQTTEIE